MVGIVQHFPKVTYVKGMPYPQDGDTYQGVVAFITLREGDTVLERYEHGYECGKFTTENNGRLHRLKTVINTIVPEAIKFDYNKLKAKK